MSAPKSVTVFVQRRGGVFIAETMSHDAIGASAGEACRRCGAASLGVDEREIEVLPDKSHTMIARVRPPERPAPAGAVMLAVGAFWAAALALWLYWRAAR